MSISVRQAWLDDSAWQPLNGLESADGIQLNLISERGSFLWRMLPGGESGGKIVIPK
ncbi:hypothetical protein QUF58_06345 [Anaerolineales bacterium HSG24]|nr:hypothetical protein [Anaerolineales bacterium HSG24]